MVEYMHTIETPHGRIERFIAFVPQAPQVDRQDAGPGGNDVFAGRIDRIGKIRRLRGVYRALFTRLTSRTVAPASSVTSPARERISITVLSLRRR